MSTTTTTPLQAALEAIDTVSAPNDIIGAKCRALMRGYDRRWSEAGYVALEVEKTLTCDLVNPDTGAKSRTFGLGGKLDVIADFTGRMTLIDHKTTSMDIEAADAPYWRQLAVEGQASHYGILGWANGYKFDCTIWDAIKKPTISPKKLTKAERAHVLATGEYFGSKVSVASLESLQVEERETAELYEARLANDCLEVRPGYYFQRRPVPRVDFELIDYAKQLWDIAQDLIGTRAANRHHKNSGACMNYGTPCKFLGVCSGHDTIESENWQKKQFTHNELGELGIADKDLLTNSRIRNFQTCKRKHLYEYELAVERVDEEEKEALYFGTLMHKALEAWWLCFQVPHSETAV